MTSVLSRAFRDLFNPPVRGLTSKRRRQRTKAQKKRDASPLNRIALDWLVHGKAIWSISENDVKIWQASEWHTLPDFSEVP